MKEILDLLKIVFPSLITIIVADWSFKKGFEKDERIEYIKNVRRNEVELKRILDEFSNLIGDMNELDYEKEDTGALPDPVMIKIGDFLSDKKYGIFEVENSYQIRKSYNEIDRDITILNRRNKYADEQLEKILGLFTAIEEFESCIKKRFEDGTIVKGITAGLNDDLKKSSISLFESLKKSIEAIERLMDIDLYNHNKIWNFFNKI